VLEHLLEFLIDNIHWVITSIHSWCLRIQRKITSHQRPLSTIFDILTLKRFLSYMLILCSGVQNLSLDDDSNFFFYTQKYEHLFAQCLPYLSQNPLRSLNLICTTRIFLVTVFSDPDLYRHFAFHMQNLMSTFHCLHRTKGIVQVLSFVIMFVT